MKTLIITVLILVMLTPLVPYKGTYIAQASEPTIQEYIKMFANQYGVSEKEIRETIRCESGFLHRRKDGKIVRGLAGEVGLAQFMPATFMMFSWDFGEELNIYSARDQIELMSWAFSQGLERHWSCFKSLKKQGII